MNKNRQRVLILTGASRGIGHATVKKFKAENWRIITCSRQPFDENCPWPAGSEDHVQIDLSNQDNVKRGIKQLKDKLAANGSQLDALVNNAGTSPKGTDGERLTSLTTSSENWEKVFNVNFFAPILLAKGLFEELKKASGSIVNVTSIVGSRVHPFAGTAYATSKSALAGLTREMASDFGPHGVRVNAIAPG